MKKYLILFILLSINVYSQKDGLFQTNYEAIYSYISKPDSTNNSTLEQKMVLYIGDNSSIFQNFYKQKLDSVAVAHTFSKGDVVIDLRNIPFPKINYVILKNNSDKKILFTEELETTNLGYIDEVNDLNWKITNEKSEINGYKCIKAQTSFRGRKFIAWFTQEIPFQDGPYKFSRLPGFIVQLKDDKEFFFFNLVSFKKINKKIFYNDKYVSIDKKEYYQKKLNYYNNIIAESENINIRKRKITYNPIELK